VSVLLTDFYSVIDMGQMSIAYRLYLGNMKATGRMKNIEVGSKVILVKNLNDTQWDDVDWTVLLQYQLQ